MIVFELKIKLLDSNKLILNTKKSWIKQFKIDKFKKLFSR